MAAGGAGVTVGACTDGVGPPIARVETTNSNVLAVRSSRNTFTEKVDVDLVTGMVGESDLVLYDRKNAEIARVTLSVADTTDLVVEQGWTGTSAAVLAGQPVGVHATTNRGDETLVGTGAVKFSLTGSLTMGSASPPDFLPWGDASWFSGQPGMGSVVASCPSARTEVPVTIVDPSALTSLETSPTALRFAANEYGTLRVSAFFGTQEVYGARCKWTSSSAALRIQPDFIDDCSQDPTDCRIIVPGAQLDAPPSYRYVVEGPSGHYQATCTIPGGHTTTVSIDID